MKIRVGVIFGGESVEHEVSIISAVQAMYKMDTNQYEVIPIYITKDREWYTGECLKDTLDRLLPYWHSNIRPTIQQGKNVLIVAHGNSLRALIQFLDNMTNDQITQLNIPTGTPLVY